MRIDEVITKGKYLIFYQFLSSDSDGKCMESSLENSVADIEP